MLRILTDRRTEYCGRPEQHPYELYLAINNIDHTKTKAKSPQTNAICERFHKTILQEFYQVTFRKKLYQTIETLQADLDEWMRYYNHERTHQGKMRCGRTPWQTWLDAIPLWKQKVDTLNQHPITTKNSSDTFPDLSPLFVRSCLVYYTSNIHFQIWLCRLRIPIVPLVRRFPCF